MAELFQYYFNGFKYVYLKNVLNKDSNNIPKETIVSKSLTFGSTFHNYDLFYEYNLFKNNTCYSLDNINRVFNYINSKDIFQIKPENNNNELGIFDSLELYSIIQKTLKGYLTYDDLKRFVEQKHNEHINVPFELIVDTIYKHLLDFKFPINISENIKIYLNKKYKYDKMCVLIDFECNDLSYLSDKRWCVTKSSPTIRYLINKEFYKCGHCDKYYDVSCTQIDGPRLCYYCHYKIYNTYPDGKNLLNNFIDKIHFNDCTFVEIIKNAFIKHFITYFDIENDLKNNDYYELIKNKDFLNKIYNLNLYKDLFINLMNDSINGEYNEYTLMLIEDFNEM